MAKAKSGKQRVAAMRAARRADGRCIDCGVKSRGRYRCTTCRQNNTEGAYESSHDTKKLVALQEDRDDWRRRCSELIEQNPTFAHVEHMENEVARLRQLVADAGLDVMPVNGMYALPAGRPSV